MKTTGGRKMEIARALQLLAEYRKELDTLRGLHHSRPGKARWHNKVNVVLEAAFGKESDEFRKLNDFGPIVVLNLDDAGEQREYLRDLDSYDNRIQEILDKYEILGVAKALATEGPEHGFGAPVRLFDAMHFHAKIVEASRPLFADGHYAEAIFAAFKAVENFVRQKSGSALYGKQLMASVFNEERPIIQVPEGGHIDKDVQEGFKFLFMGASQGIRNPKAHQDVRQDDPYITLEYLGLASLLLKRISYWEAGNS